ncbi:PIN domain-containing protein [Enterobacter asburiae]|uniref:PIN domain-containing protein n=1 Tax=Enterobacter asburiae TaxID=61645 RepID=UPI002175BE74|nr:PIN domain-containing protein [Enterobacter asburiae]MCS5456940.1 PIN domain-containing protein [Enterobacter asburiae]
MELQTRLVFIDTSAYEIKKLQFGHFVLGRLQQLVEEKKIHLLITDVVRSEIEQHLKKFADSAVKEHKNFRKKGSFLCVADEITGGGLFPEITPEAVLDAAMRKFQALVDNGFTETVSVASVNPKQIFDDYFSGAAPFHREAKKSEFPDAFSIAAVDALARARHHKVYVVSDDGDMAAVAAANDNFIHLKSIDVLLDLVNRNDEELAELSTFADSILEQLKDEVIAKARDILHSAEFTPVSSSEYDPAIYETKISSVSIEEMQLIDVNNDDATYEITFKVDLTVSYDYEDYSAAVWDKEDRVYYGVEVSSDTYRHQELYTASLEIGFMDGIRANAEIHMLSFDDSVFCLDLDTAEYVEYVPVIDAEPQLPDPF